MNKRKESAWAVMHETECCAPVLDACIKAEVRVPGAWGGGDEPLYTWYRVFTITICEYTAYRWLVIESHVEDLVAHDYIEGKVKVFSKEEAEEFEPSERKCFKVVSPAPAQELLRVLTSYAREEPFEMFSSYVGLLADYFLLDIYANENVYKLEWTDNELTINGKRRLMLSDASSWIEEREAALVVMHAQERALREWAEEYEKNPERAAKKLLGILEELGTRD
jgi:hypothetical protein